MKTSGWYKPGILWILTDQGEYLLDQNRATGSVFAEAARRGRQIQWVLSEEPSIGHVLYTGEVILDGERMTKLEAKAELVAWIREQDREAIAS